MDTPTDAQIKALTAQLKCPDPESEGRDGRISMVVGNIGIPDPQGDMFMPGSIGRQNVLISPWQHGVWRGAIPIGKGVIYEDGDKIQFEGQFNMELEDARNTFSAIAFAPELIEASIGFLRQVTQRKTYEGKSVNGLVKVLAKEVTMAIAGVQPGTHVTALKAEEEPPPEAAQEVPAEPEPTEQLPSAEFIEAQIQLASLLEENHG